MAMHYDCNKVYSAIFIELLTGNCPANTHFYENSPETRIFEFQNGGLHAKAADIQSRVCSNKLDENPRMFRRGRHFGKPSIVCIVDV